MLINRVETRSRSIAAAPERVFAYVADGANLPLWAPAFAPAVRRAGEEWIVENGDAAFSVLLPTSAAAGTVDIVAAADRRRGAFTRVLPNGDGATILFTLFFRPDTPHDAVAAQMAEVDSELDRIRAACEA